MDDDQQFCLRWNNHQSTLVAVFDTLLENGTLVDCTLAAEGKCLNAHKVVLSACSPYFEALLSRHFDKHPILILKDVKFQELKAMMDYMYRGEVNISQDQLGALLKAAESLQIKGLSDNRKGEPERKTAPVPPPPKSPQQTSALPKVQGLTIEQRSRDDSREGSLSPGPRKKKRLRRKSEELDNHDASNSSESHSLPAQNIPSSLPAASKINADVPEPVETKSDILRHKQPDDIPQVPIIKEKIETHTELMLEPKSEYVEEMNEDSIEDLTLDDDDLSNMEQLEDQAGPSHGNAGEGSSQGFGGWHMGNQSQDEVFLAAQEAVGAHRDSQGILWTERRSIFPNGLEHLLKSVPDGQIVLLKQQGLDNPSRQKLVKIVIDNLILQNNPSHKFPSILRDAAQEIVELFPGERLESYFIPYSKKTYSKDKILPRGKLYSRWVNCKRALTIAKFDKPSEGQRKDKDDQGISIVDITENEKVCYNSLLQPENSIWEETLKDWRSTFNIRMLKLKSLESGLIYFHTFPALKQPMGYKLFEEDFNMKYPSITNQSMHKIWPGVASAIVEILRGKQVQAPELYSMSIDLAVLSLKVLPWLFQPTILRNKITKKNFKLNRLEMADRFFLHVVGPQDLDARLNDRRKKLQEFDIKIQPIMVVVGPLQNPQAFFVVLDNQRYMFNDILTTLDVTFKIFFALDIPFPCECRYLWQTIDQLVYRINANVDPASSVVLSEIEQKLKKQ
ncbi:uncharacterized protein LOC108905534 isoform X1 [Anoplophora glabripennis]|uniref:uncharacterized protein LOC108905534 isoform X1 n=1 Tax=Anoplophora glabripennis TaxID=217634 RepID=UPI000C781AFE|nr:uncharacterized protein LOC108905534 isoform X1 [Anoplophora glabripennis]